MASSYPPSRAALWAAILWCALLAAALAFRLGGYPLLDPDEGRNAEVAREMAASNDYLLPQLDGLPYLDKPVLFFAAEAAAMEVLGPTEVAARLPSLLCALLTAGLAGWLAGRLYDRGTAWRAATATAAAPLAVAMGRTVIFDSMLALWTTLALAAFYLSIEAAVGQGLGLVPRTDARPYLRWTLLAWGALALALLTKGPVALMVVLLPAAVYAAWRRASRAVWHPAGIALAALLVAPWLWAVSHQAPGFLGYALLHETWQRISTDRFQRSQPFWFFLPVLLVGTLPWSIVALARLRRGRREGRRADPRTVFLLLWLALPFVGFSLSRSKLPHYMLPLVPAVAILAAAGWRERPAAAADPAASEAPPQIVQRRGDFFPPPWEGGGWGRGEVRRGAVRVPRGARAAAAVWLLLGAACLVAAPRLHVAGTAALVHAARESAAAFGAVAAAAGVAALALLAWRRRGGRRLAPAAWAILAVPAAAIAVVTMPLLSSFAGRESGRSAAAALAPLLTPDAEVVGVQIYPASLGFYLGRPILVSSATGKELTSNYLLYFADRARRAPGSPLRPLGWWRQALASCPAPRAFVVDSRWAEARGALAAALPLLTDNGRFATYGPCRPPHEATREAARQPAAQSLGAAPSGGSS